MKTARILNPGPRPRPRIMPTQTYHLILHFKGPKFKKKFGWNSKKNGGLCTHRTLGTLVSLRPLPYTRPQSPFCKIRALPLNKDYSKISVFTISAASNAKKKWMKFEICRLARILRGSSAKNEQNSKNVMPHAHCTHVGLMPPRPCAVQEPKITPL